MKNVVYAFLILMIPFSLSGQEKDSVLIDVLLTEWHQAAASADFDGYFGRMAEGAIFIGTDASENWNKEEFMEFSRPYFERGQAWSFKAVERNIYLGPEGDIAWFDELLDTWMQICRGSGVVRRINGQWKIVHYVLSMTMPNDEVQGAIDLKRKQDSLKLRELRTLIKQ